jgi:DNA end-binding protein Ku
MARPIWSGAISFGLVNVPVKLFSAVSQKEVRFHMLHDKEGARIKQKRVCSVEGTEVPYEHIAKGYEVSSGQYVMITPEELEGLDPKASRTIDIQDFVDMKEIDPIYWEHSYYLVPDRGAAKAYSLLLHAMKKVGRVGIARMVMRTKMYLCTLRPMGRTLTLSTMLYSDEVVDASDLEGVPTSELKPSERELEMAEQLVDSLAGPFKPEKYKDDYREKVLELIEKKAEGEQIVMPEEPAEPAKVVNLMDALKASLAAQRKAAPLEESGERRHRAQAARTTKKKGRRPKSA